MLQSGKKVWVLLTAAKKVLGVYLTFNAARIAMIHPDNIIVETRLYEEL